MKGKVKLAMICLFFLVFPSCYTPLAIYKQFEKPKNSRDCTERCKIYWTSAEELCEFNSNETRKYKCLEASLSPTRYNQCIIECLGRIEKVNKRK